MSEQDQDDVSKVKGSKHVVVINITDEDGEDDFGGVDIEIDKSLLNLAEVKHKISEALDGVEGIEVTCVFT